MREKAEFLFIGGPKDGCREMIQGHDLRMPFLVVVPARRSVQSEKPKDTDETCTRHAYRLCAEGVLAHDSLTRADIFKLIRDNYRPGFAKEIPKNDGARYTASGAGMISKYAEIECDTGNPPKVTVILTPEP